MALFMIMPFCLVFLSVCLFLFLSVFSPRYIKM